MPSVNRPSVPSVPAEPVPASNPTLRQGARGPAVARLQAALNQAGFDVGAPDGRFGTRTAAALKSFQQANGLTADGVAGAQVWQKLSEPPQAPAASPAPGGWRPRNPATTAPVWSASGTAKANPAAVGESARRLVEERAIHYGVDQPWVNIDPNHALRPNTPQQFLKGRWKCNLFGGNALHAAGFEPPFYGNAGRGEYPNANQWYKWSDKYASAHRNKVHFKLVDEVPVVGLDPARREAAIAELMKKAQPGDMLMADHLGDTVADGGHTRVVVANNFERNGTVDFAQASFDQATIKSEAPGSLVGEERIWLLRPNRPRAPNQG
ncbi:MAG: peptidoglycan-binding protein [Myxococcales bacterium]|nr:peptidoglycan-binding protein [Myxococcales bacterium]